MRRSVRSGDVVDLHRASAAAVGHARLLRQQAAGLELVSRGLLRGDRNAWRHARVSGGSGPVDDGEAAPDGGPGRRKRFAGRPEDVHAVRAFVEGAASGAGVEPDAAMLAASEMATNVVRHAGTSFLVSVFMRPGHLRVELTDGSALLPAIANMVREDSEHGRGMRIIDAVTDRWGADLRPDGKIVWFEIDG